MHEGSVLLSGGVNDEFKVFADTFMLVVESGNWWCQKSLEQPRCCHSSCANYQAVYVFGGMDESNKMLQSIERLALMEERDY